MSFLAIDTETTGLDFWHGCRPFAVSICSDEGKTWFWEWPVDPMTRRPEINEEDVSEIFHLICRHCAFGPKNSRLVFHNSLFDLRSLSHAGIDLSHLWDFVDDTIPMSHVLDNLESHGLKDLALRYADVSDDDEYDLSKIVTAARRKATKKGWRVAKANDPHWPGMRRGTWWKQDMWIPREIVRRCPEELPEEGHHKPWIDDAECEYCGRSCHSYECTACGGPLQKHSWIEALERYAVRDAERTAIIFPILEDALISEELHHVYREQRQLLRITYDLESRGCTLKPSIRKRLVDYQASADKFHKDAVDQVSKRLWNGVDPPNLNSPKQLGNILHSKEGGFDLPIIKRTQDGEGPPSTDADTILKHWTSIEPKDDQAKRCKKFLTDLLLSRKLQKAADYVESYILFSREETRGVLRVPTLHAKYNPWGPDTPRYSSSDPNQQNVGKPEDGSTFDKPGEEILQELLHDAGINLRSVFGPCPGRLWYSKDFQQLQLRIFAYESGEESLIQAFRDGWDAHDYMAHRIFTLRDGVKPTKSQRRIGKNVNFGFIFGASPKKIDETARRPGLYDELSQMFRNAHQFIQSTSRQVRRRGYVYCRDSWPVEGVDSAAYGKPTYRLWINKNEPYKGVNYIVQGDEGIIVKRAMINCHRYLNSPEVQRYNHRIGPYLTMMVHDDLTHDTPRDFPIKHVWGLVDCMEAAGASLGMETPVECERIETSWDRGEKMKRSAA